VLGPSPTTTNTRHEHDVESGWRLSSSVAVGSGVELAAALKIMALGVRADKVALLVDEFRAAHGTKLPPVVLLGLR